MATPLPASSRRMAARSSTTSWTPLTRAGLAERQARADHHRARRAWRGHLHHAHVLGRRGVMVEAEAHLPGVEVLGGIDVADRDGNHFELHVHNALLPESRAAVT